MTTDASRSSSATPMEGRALAPTTSAYLLFVTLVLVVTGPALAISSFLDHRVSAWVVASPVTLALVGGAFTAIIPALVSTSTAALWENARVLALPVVIVVWGLLAVTVVGVVWRGDAASRAWYLVMWLVGLGALALGSVPVLVAQFREPRLDLARILPLPAWTKPPIAVLGSGHLGLGVGLLGAPEFWGRRIPWDTNLVDARVLGVWCLGLGVGLLGALAEDDLLRLRGGMRIMLGVGIAELAALAIFADEIDGWRWDTGAALALAGGLVATGVVGQLIVRAHRVTG